jgi:hypothetical protein
MKVIEFVARRLLGLALAVTLGASAALAQGRPDLTGEWLCGRQARAQLSERTRGADGDRYRVVLGDRRGEARFDGTDLRLRWEASPVTTGLVGVVAGAEAAEVAPVGSVVSYRLAPGFANGRRYQATTPSQGFPAELARAPRVPAILIGVNDYDGNGDLGGCVQDARSFGVFLRGRFGSRVKAQLLADRPNDRWHVKWPDVAARIARASTDPYDHLYFYYSGHGSPGSLYFPKGPVTGAQLATAINGAAAKNVYVVLDSCFAGSMAQDLLAGISADKNLLLALAVKPDQVAFECQTGICPPERPVGGVFTQWLLREMGAPRNDRNRDGLVSWREALAQASTRIRADLKMNPVFRMRAAR